MATDTSSTGNAVPCPDPSVHRHKTQLSEQASTAALYVTHPERATEVQTMEKESPLGPDGKLSSKSAAASLKYARAQDLPSFPSHGHGADSASKAAMLAKDYKPKEPWQPELSAAGSRAALAAHGKGGKLDLWQPSATAEGNSAASTAMRNKSLSPQIDYGYTPDGKSRALLAATMSVNKGRQRAESTPPLVHPAYPDSHNATHNALNAATVSHRTSVAAKPQTDGWDSEANQAARITHLGNNMDRAMFTEHPPIELEREEAKYNAALRASAVSMAKQMYDPQARTESPSLDRNIGVAGAGAGAAHARNPSASQPVDLKAEAMRYINLQEAAHKLAAERLAKVDKNFEAARYREYYGYEDKPKSISSRFSFRGRARTSSDADADDDSDDEGQARRIRSQMSQLNSGLNSVENKKQQDDRAKLLAAAEKRVSARMQNIDEKVFLETGKVSPAMMEEWEEKARKRAQEEKDTRAQHPGKTHIGGGKYMDRSEIEAIAAARLKPTLDEINDTAEKKRAKDEELRLEKEESERAKKDEKARTKEEKDEQKRVKSEEKAAAKKEKEEAKARKDEEKRAAKEDKRKSRDVKKEEAGQVAAAGAAGTALGEVTDIATVSNEPVVDGEPGRASEPALESEQQPEAVTTGAAEPPAGAELEPEITVQSGVEKHRSALSRLKERFKRSEKKEADAEADTSARPDESTEMGAITGAAAAGAAGAGAAAIPTILEPAGAPETLDAQQAAHAVEEDKDDEDDDEDYFEPAQTSQTEIPPVLPASESTSAPAVVEESSHAPSSQTQPDVVEDFDATKPHRPRFVQAASLSGLHADEIPSASQKPDLERHISQIPDISEDEDSDWDTDEIQEASPRQSKPREDKSRRIVAAPILATPSATSTVPSYLNKDQVSPMEETYQPSVPTVTEPAEPSLSAAEAPTIPAVETAKEVEESGPSSVAPIASDAAANDVPTAAAGELGHHHNKLHKDPPPKVQEELKAEAEKRKSADVDDRPNYEEGEKERKGLRGLFNKLRNKPSRPENKYPDFKSPSETDKAATPSASAATDKALPPPLSTVTDQAAVSAVPEVAPAASTATTNGTPVTEPTAEPTETPVKNEEHIGTDGPIGDASHVSGLDGNPRPESLSSFKRGVAQPTDLDDVSSSGADEDDVKRGRAGRLARKLGLRRDKGKAPATVTTPADAAVHGDDESHTEAETFEEARDHFDEAAAPQPAFAGQAKNVSPVRNTKFQEEL